MTAAIALAGGFLVNQLLTATGRSTFTPLVTLPVLLIALGAIVVALAVPVWRASRGHTRTPINPFRALRIAMLAKASSLLGAAAVGFAAGRAAVRLDGDPADDAGRWAPLGRGGAGGRISVHDPEG